MRKEYAIGYVALLGLLSFSAFKRGTRKEIGKRDNWTCQGLGEECYLSEMNGGKPASWDDGFMMTAAHYPELHGQQNNNPDAGRILCVCCHAIEELERGNEWGAGKLLEMGIYHVKHARKTGEQVYLIIDDLIGSSE